MALVELPGGAHFHPDAVAQLVGVHLVENPVFVLMEFLDFARGGKDDVCSSIHGDHCFEERWFLARSHGTDGSCTEQDGLLFTG